MAQSAYAADSFPSVDDDLNGTTDTWLAGCDKDNDGYGAAGCTGSEGTTGGDCDDNDNGVIPDGWQYLHNCTAGQVDLCQANGNGWRGCQAFVEAHTGAGDDYFVDPVSGDDTADGLSAATGGGHGPWKTRTNFSSHSGGHDPAQYHAPIPGDVFWSLAGTQDQIIADVGNANCGTTIWCCDESFDGDATHQVTYAAYPGAHAVLSGVNMGVSTEIYFETCKYTTIRDHDFNGAGLKMIVASDTDITGNQILHNRFHDYQGGLGGENAAGIYIHAGDGATPSTGVRVSRNIIYHNTSLETGHEGRVMFGIIWFRGGANERVDHNQFFNDAGGLYIKHGNPSLNYTIELDHNIGLNINPEVTSEADAALLLSGSSINAHDNILVSAANETNLIKTKDGGGDTSFGGNSVIDHNTSMDGKSISLRPEYCVGSCVSNATKGTWAVTNNIIYADGSDPETIEFCRRGVDDTFDDYVPSKLTFTGNFYITPTTTYNMSLFGDSSGTITPGECTDATGNGTTDGKGVTYASLALAQGAGYEANSFDKNSLTFNSSGEPTGDVDANGKGWRRDYTTATALSCGRTLSQLRRGF